MTQAVAAAKPGARREESSSLWALVVLARRLGIDTSYAELRRNYALPEGEPETRTIIAIAHDLGIDARAIRVKFRDLRELGKSLPAMLKVTSGGALILESAHIDQASGPVAVLSDPTVSHSAVTPIDEIKLNSIWRGEIILLKRRHSVSDETQPFGLSWLFAQVMREGKLFRDIGAAAVISTIFALAPPFIFMIVVNRVLANNSMSTLKVLAGGMALLIVFETILMFLRRSLTEVATTRIDGRLNLYLMERLLKLPMDYFEHNPTGRITSKIGRMWQIRQFLTGSLLSTVLDSVPLIGLIPALFILDWRLASLVMVLAAITFLIIMAFIKPLGRSYGRVVLAEQARYTHLIETIHGMRTIKALALEGRRRREWDSRTAESTAAHFAMGQLANWPPTLTLPFERLIYSGSICLGAYFALTSAGSGISAGALGAFAMLANRLGSPLMQMARLQLDFAEVRGAIHELASVLNTPPEDARENSGLRQPIEGSVSFKDVRFRYSKEAPYALDGINFSVPKGTSIGVMGRSGSGKTTITRMLQRLNSNYDGLIKIDGMDLREINLNHLRANVGIVLQENFLFSGSIRANIGIAKPDATFAEIVHAAQLAGAEEFIERMPRGYETMLEEGATNLSGGQRQRLAIARTLLTNPPILLLDEATSALDAESEAIINANLKRIAEGRTVISISHRLSMLVDSDVILVLERGRLYDSGRHEELLARCDIYQQMWYQQNRHMDRASKPGPVAAIGHG